MWRRQATLAEFVSGTASKGSSVFVAAACVHGSGLAAISRLRETRLTLFHAAGENDVTTLDIAKR